MSYAHICFLVDTCQWFYFAGFRLSGMNPQTIAAGFSVDFAKQGSEYCRLERFWTSVGSLIVRISPLQNSLRYIFNMDDIRFRLFKARSPSIDNWLQVVCVLNVPLGCGMFVCLNHCSWAWNTRAAAKLQLLMWCASQFRPKRYAF